MIILKSLPSKILEQLVEQSIGKNVFYHFLLCQNFLKQFYYHEVIGFEIREEDGKSCGNIVEINDQTAQHYFILKLADKEVIFRLLKIGFRSKP
jgi:16S rRNA processing protein RimM